MSANSATAKPSGSFESPADNGDDGGDEDDDDDDNDDGDNDCDGNDGGDDGGITGDDNHQQQSHIGLDCEFRLIKDIFCNIIAALSQFK